MLAQQNSGRDHLSTPLSVFTSYAGGPPNAKYAELHTNIQFHQPHFLLDSYIILFK